MTRAAALASPCHPERSEGSGWGRIRRCAPAQILRFVQDDRGVFLASRSIAAILPGAILLVLALAACGPAAPAWDASASRASAGRTAQSTGAVERPTARPADPPADRDPLAAVSEGERAEVRDELARIRAGGPFLHRRDGIAFGNREGRLPPEPAGYYREYTVETPGAPDRGARRLIVGRGGEVFYSHDHYRSFMALGRAAGAAP